MEILIEILIFLAQFVFEVILQLFFEALAELGVRGVGQMLRRPEHFNPWVAGAGYALLGAIAGGLSLWFFPALFIDNRYLRAANLIVTPLVAGAMMGAVGDWRRRRDQELIRLDRFSYGALFAFTMALVRFTCGL